MEGTLVLIGFIALCFALVAIFVVRPKLTTSRGGKIMAFLVFFLLPVLAFSAGFSAKLQGAKNTSFCLSCHIMEPYGKSLLVDDPMHLAAAHFQNHRVPAQEACYTCHTTYAMFGG